MPVINEDHRKEAERALQAGDAGTAWERIRKETEEKNSIARFFGSDDSGYYEALGRDAKISTLNRLPSRTSFVKFYMLFTGSTLDDVIHSENMEDDKRMGDLTVRMLSENKILDTMTPQEREESAGKYGELYYSAARKMEEAEIPVMDLSNPVSRAAVSSYYGILRALGIDYSQTKRDVQRERGFADVYGGVQAMNEIDDRIDTATTFFRSVYSMDDPREADEARMAAFLTVRHFSDRLGGKKIKDLPADKALVRDMDSFSSAAMIAASGMEDEQKKAILNYMTRGGKEPEMQLDIFDRTALNQSLRAQEKLWDGITDEHLSVVEHGRVCRMHMFLYGKEDKARYYRIARRSGEFEIGDRDSRQTAEEKEQILEEADLCFRNLCHEMNIQKDHPAYRQAGYETEESLFFIDGEPAEDYVKKKYPSKGNRSSEEFRKLAHAEIVSAVLSGEHHVEAAQLSLKKNGAYDIAVTEVRADASQLDGQERFYHTKPSKKAEKFYAGDRDREQRLKKIRDRVSGKFAESMRSQINERQYEQTAYAEAGKRFDLGDRALNRQYFDSDAMGKIRGIPSEETSELLRGDYGGLRDLAQWLAMAKNPQIRVADLADPEKFRQEKRAAGTEVAAAFSALFAGPDKNHPEDKTYLKPAADIMKAVIRRYPEMDIRKEIAYVLGQPLDIKAEELKEIMNRPENMIRVSGLSRMISSLSVDTFQVLEAVYSKKKQPISKLNPAADGDYPPLYQELAQTLTEEDKKKYQNAIDATRSLAIEKKWNDAVKGTMMGEAQRDPAQDAAVRVMGDYIRDRIVSGGKMGEIPNAYQLQMMSTFSSAEFKAVKAAVEKAQAAGKREAAVDYLIFNPMSSDFRKQLLPEKLQAGKEPEAAEAVREKVSLTDLQKREVSVPSHAHKEEKKLPEEPEKKQEAPQTRPRSRSFPR